MLSTICMVLFIVATGLLVWLKALTKKLVLLLLFSGPGVFFLSLYMAAQVEDQAANPWTTVFVLFAVFFCLGAGYVNKRTPPEERLSPLEILLLLACQPLVCLICYNMIQGQGLV